MKILTVLVNWRQPKCTIAAIESVAAQNFKSDICVVDNNSDDGSLELLKVIDSDILIIESKTNSGFGAGCNLAMSYALEHNYDFVWLLNNDAVAETQALGSMLKIALSDDEIGAVGGCIYDISCGNKPHAGSILNPITFTSSNAISALKMNNSNYSWITGACLLLRVKALRQVGLFDARYFMYWEDADICMRLKRAGWKFGVAADAKIQHAAGTSSHQMRTERFEWHMISCLLWIEKNYTFKYVGKLIWLSRNIVKSIINMDYKRLRMTIKFCFSKS